MGPTIVACGLIVMVVALPYVMAIFYKWFDAGMSVLTNDKEGLNRCNLCEDDPYIPLPPEQTGNEHWRKRWEDWDKHNRKTYSGGE